MRRVCGLRRRLAGRALALAIGAIGGLAAGAAVAQSPPQVVASIAPVHSLVAGVMRGVGEPHLLLKGAATPHSYSLRPSDAAALREAALVFWVGEGLETFLEKPLDTLAGNARVVALGEAAGLELLPTRRAGLWQGPPGEDHDEHHEAHGDGDQDEHQEADHDDDEHGHVHGFYDMHVWLDPQNAARLVDAIAAALSDADPDNAGRYADNAADLLQRLAQLDLSLADRFAGVQDTPYIVFHDGYHYLEHRYGLMAVGALSVSPERAPGAKRVSALRERIEETGVRCVFSEPQFEPALARTIVAGTPARLGELDPLGVALTPGPEAYFQLMERLAEDLVGCLSGSS